MERTQIPVAEIMTKRPVTVKSGQSVTYAATIMKKYKISSVLVLDKKKLLGIITTDDIVYKVLPEKKDAQSLRVDDIMTTDLVTVSPLVDLQKAMQILSDNDIRQLPILNNDLLVGFVTLKDILRYEPTLVDLMVENIRFEEQQRQQKIKSYSEGTVDESLFE